MFSNYRLTFSVTHMFFELGLPTFDTLMHRPNSRITFLCAVDQIDE